MRRRSLIPLGALLLAGCGGGDAPVAPGSEPAPAEDSRRRAAVAAMAEGWEGDIRFGAPYDALDTSVRGEAAGNASLFDPADEYWGLPRTPGFEDVYYSCSGCHSLRLVMQQRSTGERWAYLLDWMVEDQGMAPLEAESRAVIEEYLIRHFGPSD